MGGGQHISGPLGDSIEIGRGVFPFAIMSSFPKASAQWQIRVSPLLDWIVAFFDWGYDAFEYRFGLFAAPGHGNTFGIDSLRSAACS